MKLLPRKSLLSGAACLLAATALPACTSYVSEDVRPHYEIRGPFYRCDPDGVCHNVRSPSYYWRADSYRSVPRYHYRTLYGPKPLPQQPRPL